MLCFFDFFRAIFLCDGIDISISLQLEFTESLMISGLFAVIALSVLIIIIIIIIIIMAVKRKDVSLNKILTRRNRVACHYHSLK